MKYFPIWLIVLVLVSCGERSAGVVAPAVVTESVDGDPDDPAIWMNVRDGGRAGWWPR